MKVIFEFAVHRGNCHSVNKSKFIEKKQTRHSLVYLLFQTYNTRWIPQSQILEPVNGLCINTMYLL